MAGPEGNRENRLAAADVRQGRVKLTADGRLGRFARLHALVDAEPDRDKFDIDVDYQAPKGGVLAGMIGAQAGYRALIKGKGAWKRWEGYGHVARDGEQFAAFRIGNQAGRYTITGQAKPETAIAPGLLRRAAGGTVSYKAVGLLQASVLSGSVVPPSQTLKRRPLMTGGAAAPLS